MRPQKRGNFPSALGLFAMACVSCFSLGVAVALGATAPFAPSVARSASVGGHLPVVLHRFSDPRPVRVAIQRAPDLDIASPASGVVTAVKCVPGSAIASGSAPFAIDGSYKLALATAVPFWRDLQVGDQGGDVAALKASLVALGHPEVASGGDAVDESTIQAVSKLLVDAGGEALSGQISRASLLWTPGGAVLRECVAGIGSHVQSGQPLAKLRGRVISASFPLPGKLPPGARLVRIGDVSIPVDSQGEVQDLDLVEKGLTSVPVSQPSAAAKEDEVTGSLQLVSPVEVAGVPASAIVFAAATACVFHAGNPYRVSIWGSQLGQTYVQFASDAPPEIDANPREGLSCG